MKSFTKIFFISLLILFFTTLPSRAQNSPQDYLNAHNSARAQVGVAPIVWSDTLAAYALNYANTRTGDCNLVHSNGPYGENLAKGSASTFSGTDAVNLWVAEKTDYNHASNTCASGKVCLHYTQVVWRSSTQVGCARVRCANSWWFIICSYNPRGNIIGQPPY